MDLKKLKQFIKFMDDNELCELEIEEKGKRVKLKKFSPEQPVIISSKDAAAPRISEKEEKSKDEEGIEMKSPMVGIFYRSPSPGVKPFVNIGDNINSGDIMCILEAMKLMNEIKAEISGKIVKIFVENGAPVEFGEPLFLIKPN
ncbi:MAG: acetyl-CoA carboxylase biotin carboxyl carrier protein [Candidatus Omnitrophica bacterium]|nr:acetyl-CoA carboxylase biotin carboxyl carrier protein [Candidatus Omnitrophota bacterium]